MNIRDLTKDNDLVFFDLESTGLNVVTDRIVQFAGIKFPKGGGEPVELKQNINPQMPVNAEAAAVHGLTEEMLADEPTFDEFADELEAFIGDADLSGYNLARFDIPLLMEEFDRVGIRFRTDSRHVIDVQEIFYKMEPRTLAGAMRYYCNREIEGAHDALVDVRATIDVLAGQLDMYAGKSFIDKEGKSHANAVEADVAKLHDFTRRPGQLDATNRLKLDAEGDVIFNFGKHRGQRLRDVFRREKSYYQWLQERDFSVQVKEIARDVWDSM